MKIIDYNIIRAGTEEALIAKVKKRLPAWQPIGAPFVRVEALKTIYQQAVVKYGEVDDGYYYFGEDRE